MGCTNSSAAASPPPPAPVQHPGGYVNQPEKIQKKDAQASVGNSVRVNAAILPSVGLELQAAAGETQEREDALRFACEQASAKETLENDDYFIELALLLINQGKSKEAEVFLVKYYSRYLVASGFFVKPTDFKPECFLREGVASSCYTGVSYAGIVVAMKYYGYCNIQQHLPVPSRVLRELALLADLKLVDGVVKLYGCFVDTGTEDLVGELKVRDHQYPVVVTEMLGKLCCMLHFVHDKCQIGTQDLCNTMYLLLFCCLQKPVMYLNTFYWTSR